MLLHARSSSFFFFNDTATTEIYTLSLHDALPIYPRPARRRLAARSHPLRRRATDRIPLGPGDRPARRRVVVQPLGDRVAPRRGRRGDAVRFAVVRLPGCGRLVAAVLPGRTARRFPAAPRPVAVCGAAAAARAAGARIARRGPLRSGGWYARLETRIGYLR